MAGGPSFYKGHPIPGSQVPLSKLGLHDRADREKASEVQGTEAFQEAIKGGLRAGEYGSITYDGKTIQTRRDRQAVGPGGVSGDELTGGGQSVVSAGGVEIGLKGNAAEMFYLATKKGKEQYEHKNGHGT